MRRNDWKNVYVMLFQNGLVKIGVSKNVETRMKTHEQNTFLLCSKVYFTEKCSNPFEIERIIKEHFKDKCFYGKEWIKCDFDEAVEYVKLVFSSNAQYEEKENKSAQEFSETIRKNLYEIDDKIKKEEIIQEKISDGFEKYIKSIQYGNEFTQYIIELLDFEVKRSLFLANRIYEICNSKIADKETLEYEFLTTVDGLMKIEEDTYIREKPSPYWE